MKRRTLLQWMAGVAAILPFERLRVFAQPRELTPQAIATLQEIAPTVLPSALGPARVRALVDKFVVWTRGYREGVALAHGYGHPRLVRTGASPVPRYVTQLAALDAQARARGGRWSTLDLETRRALLDAAFTQAGEGGVEQRAPRFQVERAPAPASCARLRVERRQLRHVARHRRRTGPLQSRMPVPVRERDALTVSTRP